MSDELFSRCWAPGFLRTRAGDVCAAGTEWRDGACHPTDLTSVLTSTEAFEAAAAKHACTLATNDGECERMPGCYLQKGRRTYDQYARPVSSTQCKPYGETAGQAARLPTTVKEIFNVPDVSALVEERARALRDAAAR